MDLFERKLNAPCMLSMSENEIVVARGHHLVLCPFAFLLPHVAETETLKCTCIGINFLVKMAHPSHSSNKGSFWKTCPVRERELFESPAS